MIGREERALIRTVQQQEQRQQHVRGRVMQRLRRECRSQPSESCAWRCSLGRGDYAAAWNMQDDCARRKRCCCVQAPQPVRAGADRQRGHRAAVCDDPLRAPVEGVPCRSLRSIRSLHRQ